tara:strand:- start:66 stop:992 length:927 start_codon:yes stop_codon:yes gene_type:complete
MEDSNTKTDYYDLFRRNSLFFISLVSLSLIISVSVALLSPNVFKSTSIVVPSSSKYSTGSSGSQSQLGSLANLAGINVKTGVDKGAIAFKTLSSYDFFQLLYEDDEFIKKVLAGTNYNHTDNSVDTFNPILVDENSQEWLIKPSIEKAYKIFYTKHFSTFKDRKTGFIYLHGEHRIPSVAQEIVKEVLYRLNEYIRSKDVREAHAALKYIEGKIASAKTLDVKKVLASLAEGELQVIALSEATDDFAFKIIQSPFLPETKDRPHRSRMVLVGGLLGFMISFLLVLLADFFKQKIGLKRSFPFFLTKVP